MSKLASTWLAGFVVAGLTFAAACAEDGIVIPSGQVKLVADFTAPEGRGPFPAVVIIPGAGPQTRMGFAMMADALKAQGIGVLRYDKRGCGSSTGDLSTATLGELTDDAIAVTAYLRTRSDVNQKRMALIGLSQGGAIVPMIAVKNRAIAAVVLLGAPFAAYSSLARFADAVSYDPAPVLRQVKVPVLALTGSLDLQAPASENLPIIREALAGNPDVTAMEMSGLDHILQAANSGSGLGDQPAYANPAMLKIVTQWLGRRLR